MNSRRIESFSGHLREWQPQAHLMVPAFVMTGTRFGSFVAE